MTVRVRDPGAADEGSAWSRERGEPLHGVGPRGAPGQPGAGPVSFRVPAGVILAKFGLALLVLVAAWFAGGRIALIVGVAAALTLVAFGVRDLLNRERLRADASGVEVASGYAGRRHLDWAEIERVRVDRRPRFGVQTQLLEVDAGAELYLFGRYDLGVDPEDAATAITTVRPRGPRKPGGTG